mmetsp:Transcript_6408/g.8573  ORF Transcript_6408/g.8573 Transcript_6408/m.8573 type:complete len:104 (-) Transcript_6408:715-1026(-)|eukprot:CAMPEP_0185589800 /NCGR_PEP_ID=MMETSP0434-20130131/58378_1 /TAXON_ID=626734 ORGANISM="Favella taraikaensis, Strain Fe Narragansett Bay" /NCGR_SAMPLE_ID=MMETSP0434 /ASSEMBLY_ACC=CAM_ASM_000379 /LENGTH=103 /DNA_ID=CAMNT_0028213491 /DNA_START=120 /DNA_END=431 /DNA_ORIENTATION=+
MCPNGEYYGLNFITKNTRKVYFGQFSELLTCLNEILRHQGYNSESRLSQYEQVKVLKEPDEADETRRMQMRHRNSGKLYEVKMIPPSMSDILIEDALREKNIL